MYACACLYACVWKCFFFLFHFFQFDAVCALVFILCVYIYRLFLFFQVRTEIFPWIFYLFTGMYIIYLHVIMYFPKLVFFLEVFSLCVFTYVFIYLI